MDWLKKIFGLEEPRQEKTAESASSTSLDPAEDFVPVPLKKVFTPGGQPSITYVGREHLKLEDAVREPLVKGYSINVVTGPTKSGKTVLCRHVLSELGQSCTIEGAKYAPKKTFGRSSHTP